jgi:hypothetical protein
VSSAAGSLVPVHQGDSASDRHEARTRLQPGAQSQREGWLVPALGWSVGELWVQGLREDSASGHRAARILPLEEGHWYC